MSATAELLRGTRPLPHPIPGEQAAPTCARPRRAPPTASQAPPAQSPRLRGAGDGTPSPCVHLSWPLGTLGVFFHLIVPHLYPHFTDEETEAPRGKQLPRVPRLVRGEVAFLRWLSLESPVLDTHVTQHEALNPSASRNEHGFLPTWGAVRVPQSSAAQNASLTRSSPGGALWPRDSDSGGGR